MADRPQATDKKQENVGVCPSVRSVHEVTSEADAGVERAKSQTDQTDGQIGAQATEEKAKSDFKNLSGPETDRTDQTDDLSIPPCLDRRPRCAQCNGRPDGTEQSYRHQGALVWLHKECRRFWLRENPGYDLGSQKRDEVRDIRDKAIGPGLK
jgi:hypothetical protein